MDWITRLGHRLHYHAPNLWGLPLGRRVKRLLSLPRSLLSLRSSPYLMRCRGADSDGPFASVCKSLLHRKPLRAKRVANYLCDSCDLS